MNDARLDGRKKFGLEYAEPGEPAFGIRVIRFGDDVVSLSADSWETNTQNKDLSHATSRSRGDPLNSDANGLAGWGVFHV